MYRVVVVRGLPASSASRIRRHACGETAGRFETKAAQHTLAKTAKRVRRPAQCSPIEIKSRSLDV